MKIGKVLWYRDRDGVGIASDEHQNEYYFDKSVIPKNNKIVTGMIIRFKVNTKIEEVKTISCITIPKSEKLIESLNQELKAKSKQLALF